MDLTRRGMVALGAITGLAGCNTDGESTTTPDEANESVTASDPNESATANDSSESATRSDEFFENGALVAPVDNDTVRTGELTTGSATAETVSPNVGAGPRLVAYEDDGTAKIAASPDRAVVYEGEDIGVLINEIQTDFEKGVHLHLTDLFEYGTTARIETPMKLTGERTASDHIPPEGAPWPADPVGLRYTGTGPAVRLNKEDNESRGIRGGYFENVFVDAGDGTVAFFVDAPAPDRGSERNPWLRSTFRNITTLGGSRAGFEVAGSVFESTFDNIVSFGAGGHGVYVHPNDATESQAGGAINRWGRVSSRFAGGDGIRIFSNGSATFEHLYGLFAERDGVFLGDQVGSSQLRFAYGETNGRYGVNVDGVSNFEADVLRGRDNGEADIAVGIDNGVSNTQIGTIQADQYDVRLGQVTHGSRIDRIYVQNKSAGSGDEYGRDENGELRIVEEYPWLFSSTIGTVSNGGGGPERFNAATLTDDDEDGEIRWQFDARWQAAPTLSFGRRGGGIEGVELLATSSYYAADVSIAQPGGTIDVRAHPPGWVPDFG